MTAPSVPQHRVFGEDAPRWLIWGLAVLGTMGSMSASVLLISALPNILPSRINEIWTDQDAGLSVSRDIVTTPPAPINSPVEKTNETPEAQVAPPSESHVPTAESAQTLVPAEIAQSQLAVAGTEEVDQVDEPEVPIAAEQESLEHTAEPVAQEPMVLKSASEEEMSTGLPLLMPSGVSPPRSEQRAEGAAGTLLEQQTGDETKACAPVFVAYFERGSVRPPTDGLAAKITQLAEWLSAHPEAKVYVEGHTDSVGPEESNLLLSYRRATAIASDLMEAGVARDQITIRAYGEGEPLEQLTGSAQNRRVVLSVDGRQGCLQTISNH